MRDTLFLIALLCLSNGCSLGHNLPKREFPTQEAAVAHLRGHESEFRQIAEEWLRGTQVRMSFAALAPKTTSGTTTGSARPGRAER